MKFVKVIENEELRKLRKTLCKKCKENCAECSIYLYS
jgi:hypothetical protein